MGAAWGAAAARSVTFARCPPSLRCQLLDGARTEQTLPSARRARQLFDLNGRSWSALETNERGREIERESFFTKKILPYLLN